MAGREARPAAGRGAGAGALIAVVDDRGSPPHVAAMVIEPVPSEPRAFVVRDFASAELAEGYSGALYALCATMPYVMAREADLAFQIDRRRWDRDQAIVLRFDALADAVRFAGWIG